jgi:hypothetical protein
MKSGPLFVRVFGSSGVGTALTAQMGYSVRVRRIYGVDRSADRVIDEVAAA